MAGTAKVKYMIGQVEVKQVQQAGWVNLTMTSVLKEKDIIRTGEQALCEIELPDGSVTKILDNSVLELRNFPESPSSETEFFTGMGRFFFNIKRALVNKFKVISPVGVAAIRGTKFVLINSGDETRLLVKQGQVAFSDPAGRYTVRVGPGQKSAITSGNPPSRPQAMSSNEREAFDRIEQLGGPAEKGPEKTGKPGPRETVITPGGKTAQTSGPKEPAEQPAPPPSRPGGLRTGVAIGAVTIDDQIYNQIGLRPEFSIGKLGVALDLSLYIDKDGNIRKENWDSPRDIFEKIYYVRWGLRGDPLYIKVGAVDNYRLGFGLLMNRYSNTVEYPDVIRTGMEFGIQTGKIGFDAVLNNFSELTNGGGLVGARMSYRLLGKLEIGASLVYDINQYKALKDRDGDGVPDYLDAFPDNKNQSLDSDGDGQPDDLDFDRDGDGFTDNGELLIDRFGPGADSLINELDSVLLKPAPFNIEKAKNKTQFAYALDISYPLINHKYLRLVAYSQWAQFPHNGAWGVTAPGFLAKFAFVNAYAEYRIFSKHFIPEYFNTTYELERAVFRQVAVADSSADIKPVTKREMMAGINDRLKGYVIGADFDLFNFFIFGAEYQNMTRGQLKLRTFRSSLDVNTSFVPKINRAGAYYYQNNARELFKKTEGTILGYRIEYEVAGNTSLLLDFRQTYRDLNGDGKITGSGETVKTTSIQTVIRF